MLGRAARTRAAGRRAAVDAGGHRPVRRGPRGRAAPCYELHYRGTGGRVGRDWGAGPRATGAACVLEGRFLAGVRAKVAGGDGRVRQAGRTAR